METTLCPSSCINDHISGKSQVLSSLIVFNKLRETTLCRAVARLENETRQVSSAEGASRWGIWEHAPQKILKSRGSEMLL